MTRHAAQRRVEICGDTSFWLIMAAFLGLVLLPVGFVYGLAALAALIMAHGIYVNIRYNVESE